MFQAQTPPSLDSARQLASAGRFGDAETEIRRYLAGHSSSADAHFLLGYILFSEKQPRPSLAAYTEGARYGRPSAFDLRVVGSDYIELGDYEDADRWLTQATAWEPGNLLGWYYLGRTKYNENLFPEAVAAFRRCLLIDPQNVKAQDNLGLSLQGLTDYEGAQRAFQTAIDLQNDHPQQDVAPYIDMGGLLLETNRNGEAVSFLEQAVAINPREAKAQTQLGKAYLALHQVPKAEAHLQRGTELMPDSPTAHYMLAQCYRREGKNDLAAQELKRYTTLTAKTKEAQPVPTPAH